MCRILTDVFTILTAAFNVSDDSPLSVVPAVLLTRDGIVAGQHVLF
jgi:hypothetical protein